MCFYCTGDSFKARVSRQLHFLHVLRLHSCKSGQIASPSTMEVDRKSGKKSQRASVLPCIFGGARPLIRRSAGRPSRRSVLPPGCAACTVRFGMFHTLPAVKCNTVTPVSWVRSFHCISQSLCGSVWCGRKTFMTASHKLLGASMLQELVGTASAAFHNIAFSTAGDGILPPGPKEGQASIGHAGF